MEACIADNLPPPKHERSAEFFVPMELWDQVQASYMHLFRFLQVYSNGVMPNTYGRDRIFALTRPAYFGTYNPELVYPILPLERQYEQIAALVNDMLVTVGTFVMLAQSPNDDMLMLGLAELQQNQIDPPFWLLFAVQNFVDIHFILQTKSERPYEELRDFALAAKRTLKEHHAFLTKFPLFHMRDREDELAVHETLREIEEWVLEDTIKQILSSTTQKAATRKTRVWQDFEVMRMSPVFCGMLKYCYHVQMQWKGITLVNDTGIVTAAHLYNALSQNGYLGKSDVVKWEDLEYLLELHKVEDAFMGERPKSIEDCAKRLALVQGVAPSTFARRRRGNTNRVLRSRAGSRFLAPSTPVAQILGQKYLTEADSDWHLDQLDTIVGRKFDEDVKAIKKVDDEKNAKIDKIAVETNEGMIQVLDALVPNADEVYEKYDFRRRRGWSIVTLKKKLARTVLKHHEAPFYARWSVVTREVLHQLPDDPSEKLQTSDPSEVEVEATSPSAVSDTSGDTTDDEESLDFEMVGKLGLSRAREFVEITERLKKSRTLPLEIFIGIMRESLRSEYLDIQFDYFAFFRSAFSMMLEVKEAVAPFLDSRVTQEGGRVSDLFKLNAGAVCVMPQLSLLMACDPFKAPNIINLRPWLEIDLRPVQMAAKIMKTWIKENGDMYCVTEDEREEARTANILKEGPAVKYVDDEPPNRSIERKVGWSSATGLIENLNAREMREVFDTMRNEGWMGATTAEVMARMGKTVLNDTDRELLDMRAGIARDMKKEKQRKTRRRGKKANMHSNGENIFDIDSDSCESDKSSADDAAPGPSVHRAYRPQAHVEEDVD